MTAPAPHRAAVLDETVEAILDTRTAVTEVLADVVSTAELEGLLRELTVEILEVYRTVAASEELGS